MKKLSFFALSIALAGGLVSCGGDKDDPTPTAKTKTELLTAKSWRVSSDQSTVVSGGTTVSNDDYADLKACEKDDFTKFNADKTITADQGATKCSDTSGAP